MASRPALTLISANPSARSAGSIVAQLRQSVAEGRYPPGTRLAEEAVAQDLGVSRTPVRLAFRTLAQEGFLTLAGKRGYEVRAFSADDVRCAVEVRGVLEGLAARRLCERGPTATEWQLLQQCLDDGQALLGTPPNGAKALTPQALETWSEINARFHATLVDGAGSRVVADAVARNNHLPFASADSLTFETQALDRELHKLQIAQLQHTLIVDALRAKEGARVEALVREHALIGVRYAPIFGLGNLPGTTPSPHPDG